MSGAARRVELDEQRAQAAPIDRGLLEHLLAHAIARTGLVGEAAFHAAIEDRSVTPQRFALLELVATNPGLQQVQLAEALELSRPAVTLLIDYWQARDCLERRPDPIDRRSFGIFLTEEGGRILSDLRRRVLLHERMFAAPLSEAERTELGRLLRKLYRSKDMPLD